MMMFLHLSRLIYYFCVIFQNFPKCLLFFIQFWIGTGLPFAISAMNGGSAQTYTRECVFDWLKSRDGGGETNERRTRKITSIDRIEMVYIKQIFGLPLGEAVEAVFVNIK